MPCIPRLSSVASARPPSARLPSSSTLTFVNEAMPLPILLCAAERKPLEAAERHLAVPPVQLSASRSDGEF